MKKISVILFVLYFLSIVFGYLPVENRWSSALHTIQDNFYPQDWSMFSQPPTHNQQLYYRFVVKNGAQKVDTSDYLEVLEPLYNNQKKKDPVLGKLSYQLWQATQRIKDCQRQLLDSAALYLCDPNSHELNDFVFDNLAHTADYQVIHQHARYIFRQANPSIQMDSVLVSFHTYEEAIPLCPFGPQKAKSHSSLVYNSPIHYINN